MAGLSCVGESNLCNCLFVGRRIFHQDGKGTMDGSVGTHAIYAGIWSIACRSVRESVAIGGDVWVRRVPTSLIKCMSN